MIEYIEMLVTCRTENCFNENISIPLACALPECIVFCGVCQNEITDKTKITDYSSEG
jgi:hypothetical protein